jgi:hypothetical protein
MLYPSELQPLATRLLHFYYNTRLDRSHGLSIRLWNSMNANEKDHLSESTQRTGTEVS